MHRPAWPAPPVNVADRAYFKTFRSGPQSPEMLIEPVYSRITGAWTTVIARKVTGPNGEFLGAIGRGIEPANFEKFFATVALGHGATIAMHHRDGTLLARHPHVAEMIGKNFKTGPAAQRQMFERDRSTTRLASPIDGQDRLISSRDADEFSARDRRHDHDIGRAGRLARADRDADRDRRTFRARDRRPAVPRRPQACRISTARRKQRLPLEKQRLDTAVNNMTQGLLLFDATQRLVICNSAISTCTACRPTS